jgi:hypothetical protein
MHRRLGSTCPQLPHIARQLGLEVSSIDAVTLSDGEGRENAHGAADIGNFLERFFLPRRSS